MALMEITLIPMGMESISCSPYIARALDIAKTDPKVTYALNPMGTTLEGELGDLYQCVQRMQEALFEDGVPRVYTVCKIDDRRDKYQSMDARMASVTSKQEH
ncbi:MAG: MTH1187 family thiamine-binding protein [Peptococcaceae bacterium]